MADRSKIEWCDATWNPVTGCTKVSVGCANCYAERITRRFPGRYPDGFDVALQPWALDKPRHWRKPRRVFICSMGDLFHAKVPESYVKSVLDVVRDCPQHIFLVLTKRPKSMKFYAWRHVWPDNLWGGVTVENADNLWRLELLLKTPVAHRFVSFEPLLGPVGGFPTLGLDWVIAGCESGPKRRRGDVDWFRAIRDQCVGTDDRLGFVPFFLKQMEVDGKIVKMPELDGRIWAEGPTV